MVSDGVTNASMTITNAPLTEDRTLILPDATGTVLVMPDVEQTLSDALTDITHTAPETADYAIQDLVNTGGYGFATKDEGNTVLAVIANLQARVSELEIKLGFVEPPAEE